MSRETRNLPVPEGLAGMRVDAALSKLLGISRTVAADLATDGDVLVDGAAVSKSDRLHEGSWLEVALPAAPDLTPKEELVEGMDILYSDNDIIAVHKPVGVAAHPTVGWEGPTVVGGLAAAGFRISTSGPPERKGIVHRLDVGTSGLMVVAASERAYTLLKRAFRDRTVDKTYHALVQGHPDPLSGTIDAPIGRHNSSDWRFAVTSDGKPSITHYDTLEAHQAATLVEVKLETGRTHQIRVHMAHIGCPVAGDFLYGAEDGRLPGRFALHSAAVRFPHPIDGRAMAFYSPLPRALAALLPDGEAQAIPLDFLV